MSQEICLSFFTGLVRLASGNSAELRDCSGDDSNSVQGEDFAYVQGETISAEVPFDAAEDSDPGC